MRGLDVLPAGSRRERPLLKAALSALLVVVAVAGSALLYHRSLGSTQLVPGIVVGDVRLGAVPAHELDRELRKAAARFLAGTVTLRYGASTLRATRRELGARVDLEATRRQLVQVGKSGRFFADLRDRVRARRGKLRLPLVVELDRDVALDFFTDLKEQVDRPVVPARLDLDRQTVVKGREGYLLHVYDCLVALELALARNAPAVQLAVTVRGAAGKGRSLDKVQIDHVLGEFATVYALVEKYADRGHNLKVGASKLDGKVLFPGEQLSFNETVGKRTEAEGYRMAPVITEGELVDGMAGGACQLSSTLFAASFFAGLDLLSSRPHTRPSSYIKMGLDAAVAYPTTDLVIRNPYPFPVAIHYKVNQGKVQVRILGKQRPWRKVVFERVVTEQIPFKQQVRKDPEIPRGKRVVAQRGVPGFVLERRRLMFGAGKQPKKTESRELRYPATTEIIHEGSGPPNPDWKPPEEPAPFGDVKPEFTLAQ